MTQTKSKRATAFFIIASVTFIICALVTAGYVSNKSRMESALMDQLVLTKTNRINDVLSKLLYKTQALSALVIQNNGDIRDFERVAATIVDDPAIRNVILAPDGVVTHVYPLEGNEAVIGLDYFSDGEGNHEAIAARDSGKLVLGGPFNLVQGGQALVGRFPVFIDGAGGEKNFWGLVSVTLNYPQALDGAELSQLRTRGFAFEIWRISPDTNDRQIIAHSDYTYNPNARYVEQPVQLLSADWYFRLSPIRNWYQYPETWIFTLVGLLVSLLIAYLAVHNHDLRQMRAELEALTYSDQLTGALNRRGVFKELEGLLSSPGKRFVLCYLDLNHFKRMNDTYGHSAGDEILRKFSDAFSSLMNKRNLFARIGGDEFVAIFTTDNSPLEISEFFARMADELKNSDIEHQNVNITFSFGTAVYPDDGATIDELIKCADGRMYLDKKQRLDIQ